jgi:hypothetical protein
MYVIISCAFVFIFHRVSQTTGEGGADMAIFVYFVQMCLLFVGPETWISWLSVFNMNIMMSSGTNCVAPITPMQSILLGVLVPFVIFGELLLMFGLHGLLWLCHRNRDPHRVYCARWFGTRTLQKTPYLRTTTSLFLFSYNSIAQATFTFFNCITVSSQRVLASSPAVDCNGEDYKKLTGLFGLLLALLFGIPIAILLSLIRSNKLGLLTDLKHRRRYGVLFENYTPQMFFWQVIVIGRRSALVGITVLFYTGKYNSSLLPSFVF